MWCSHPAPRHQGTARASARSCAPHGGKRSAPRQADGDGELAEALAWLQAHGADSDGSDAEDGGGALAELAAQVASLPPGARASQRARPGPLPLTRRPLFL